MPRFSGDDHKGMESVTNLSDQFEDGLITIQEYRMNLLFILQQMPDKQLEYVCSSLVDDDPELGD